MDVSSIAGAATLMQSAQTQQTLSTSMIKMNAESANKMAEMVQQGVQQTPQPAKSAGQGFSTYA